MEIIVRPEEPSDRAAIARIHRDAFPTSAEAELVDALRDGGFSRVSLVAQQPDGALVGHVLFSELQIIGPAGTCPALSLAPLAVIPTRQHLGIGKNLVLRGLETCRECGHRIVIVLGEPSYYGRFGFTAKLAAPFESPYAGEYFQALELVPGALQGVAGRVEYPPPFGRFE